VIIDPVDLEDDGTFRHGDTFQNIEVVVALILFKQRHERIEYFVGCLIEFSLSGTVAFNGTQNLFDMGFD